MQNHRPLILIAILALALILRLGSAFLLGDNLAGPLQQRIQDQVSYHTLAQSLLAGKGYTFGQYWYPFTPAHQPTAHWSFIYPLYLAGVYAVAGVHPLAARAVQVLIGGVLGVWLYYHFGRRLFGETIGLVTAGLAAVYAYFVFHDAALMTESFYILGVVAMLSGALALTDNPARVSGGGTRPALRWAGYGLILGILALLRQAILLWIPFLFLWIFWAGRSRPGRQGLGLGGPLLSLAVLAAIILPWTLRNYRVYGEFLPLNSNAGYALYSANHPNHGAQFDQGYAAPVPTDLQRQGLNEAQWNTALTKRGLEFILRDPQRYARLTLSRIGIFFNFWFSSDSDLSGSLLRVLSFGLYLPFFLLGLGLSVRAWPRSSLIYLFAIIYSAMHILTWASIRYRLPVDAALMPFAACGVLWLAERVRRFLPSSARGLGLGELRSTNPGPH